MRLRLKSKRRMNCRCRLEACRQKAGRYPSRLAQASFPPAISQTISWTSYWHVSSPQYRRITPLLSFSRMLKSALSQHSSFAEYRLAQPLNFSGKLKAALFQHFPCVQFLLHMN